MRPTQSFAAALMLLCAPAICAAQNDSLIALRGLVSTPSGTPVAGAEAFLLETLEGALTDSAGRFVIMTRHRGSAMLIVRHIGYRPARTEIDLPRATTDPLGISLARDFTSLSPVTVVAGRYTAEERRGATLTPLEVVTTPGAHADVARAIQTLPGVQAMDEGTALFVRGGDYTETTTLINGAVLPNGFSYDSPTGTFIGTVDPFLLDGIHFSSGGFGARFGNALSGIVDLRTQGRPERATGTVTAGLAAMSAAGGLPLPSGLGVRAAANRFNTALLFRVNGSTRAYSPPPNGHDLSGSIIWNYRPSAQIKIFSIDQSQRVGTSVDEASHSGAYGFGQDTRLSIATWRETFGRVATSLRASSSRLRLTQEFGAFALVTRLHFAGLGGEVELPARDNLTLRAGGEIERLRSTFEGSVPESGDDKAPGARTIVTGSDAAGNRNGLFAEAEARVGVLRVVAGARTDGSTLTGGRAADPRLSISIPVRRGITLTAAGGVYHQIPDPLFFDDSLGVSSLPSMRATHAILGLQAGEERRVLRIELYDKRYDDLAQMSRDYDVVAGGTGSARGIDVFLKGSAPLGLTGRIVYSYVAATRTDPNTGLVTRAPFDVAHTVTAVAERSIRGGFRIGAAYRFATGRPFTPVIDGTYDSERAVWTPVYGAPMSERLPSFDRVDLSASYFRRVGSLQGVAFAALTNVFDRENTYLYRYSSDYRERLAVRSLFNRALYFGFTLTLL